MSPTVERAATWLDRPAVTRWIQVVAIVSFLASLLVGIKQYTLASCLSSYNDAYSTVAGQRTEASQATNDAIDKFIRAVVASGNQPSQPLRTAAFQRAYDDYVAARAAADEQRKLNPLPTPPKERC